MILLPRQARDKHRESQEKRPFSLSVEAIRLAGMGLEAAQAKAAKAAESMRGRYDGVNMDGYKAKGDALGADGRPRL